jgi:PleD family two-component response regulator
LPEIAAATAKLRTGKIRSATVTVRVKRHDGTVVWTEITSRPIGDQNPAELGERTVVIRDITERKILQDKLIAMAMKDGLTGLANRRAFDIALAGEWANVKSTQSQMSLLLLDVDHFKEFNDAYGH